MVVAGRPDMAEDARLGSNPGRVTHQEEVDTAIGRWTASLRAAEVLSRLDEANVPGGPLYDIQDICADPQCACCHDSSRAFSRTRPGKEIRTAGFAA